MNKKGLIGKLIIINIVVLVVLLILLLFFIQGGCERKQNIEELAARALLQQNIKGVYEEAAEKPYFAKHPEELAVKELKIENLRFTKIGADSKPVNNPGKQYTYGEDVTFSFDITNYMNPKAYENYYVYGIRVWTETRDSEGNIIPQFTRLMADMANHHETKGKTLSFNMGFVTGNLLEKGRYTLKIIANDMISGINNTKEEAFTVT